MLTSPQLESQYIPVFLVRTEEAGSDGRLTYVATVYSRQRIDWDQEGGLGRLIEADGWLVQATPGVPNQAPVSSMIGGDDSFALQVRDRPAGAFRGGEDGETRYWIVTWSEEAQSGSVTYSLIGPDVSRDRVRALAQGLVERTE